MWIDPYKLRPDAIPAAQMSVKRAWSWGHECGYIARYKVGPINQTWLAGYPAQS